MPLRSAPVAVAAIVLGTLGSAAVLLVDLGPDPDDPGYTEGHSRWVRPFIVEGTTPVPAGALSDGEPACLRWTYGGRLAADVTWRGSPTDAEVDLTAPRLTGVRLEGRLTGACDSGQTLPDRRGLSSVIGRWQLGGRDDTTCGWTTRERGARSTVGAWCGDEAYRPVTVSRRTEIGDRGPAWGVEIFGNPVARWDGEASADAGGDQPFASPLCLRGAVHWTTLVSAGGVASLTGLPAETFPVCVDLWEPTPWGAPADG